MRLPAIFLFALLLTSCDLRSGTAMKEMEKFETKSTPPFPTPTPIDRVETSAVAKDHDGDTIGINGYEQTQTLACKKFDRVMINGDDNRVTINGVCRQIMVNGDRNHVTSDAAVEFVLNGSENTMNYIYLVNGKWPSVIEARSGNVVEKISAKTTAANAEGDKQEK